MANSMGVSNFTEPRHIVPIQLKNLIPVGTAIKYDIKLKKGRSTTPVVNMWCAQTLVDRAAIEIVANTMPR
jgi:hypothetical protein